jgi:hypothetical protein
VHSLYGLLNVAVFLLGNQSNNLYTDCLQYFVFHFHSRDLSFFLLANESIDFIIIFFWCWSFGFKNRAFIILFDKWNHTFQSKMAAKSVIFLENCQWQIRNDISDSWYFSYTQLKVFMWNHCFHSWQLCALLF